MTRLKIIGDPVAAARKIGTARVLTAGQAIVFGTESSMRDLARKYPDLVEIVETSGARAAPDKNKMLRNTCDTK